MDLWTAQKTRDSYLCLTGHFIDEDWVLKKKILNFELMESGHSGEEMGKVVIKCLYNWNLDKKVSTITLDNASANDLMVGRLKTILSVQYPTADLYFADMCEIHMFLNKWVESDNLLVKNMAKSMMKKFKKYWGTCNMTLSVAYVLNPGLKMKFVHNYHTEIYGEFVGASYTKMVSNSLVSLYNRYAPPKPTTVLTTQSSVTCSVGDSSKDIRLSRSLRHASWYEREGLGSANTKSELDIYLEETLDTHVGSLLVWWRANSLKYPTLSKMARDILAIPVSSVPSESAFSTGGRVLTEQRASLSPKMVEALTCTQDWLPSLDSSPPFSASESTEAYVADDEETYDAEKDDDDYNLVSLDQYESPEFTIPI